MEGASVNASFACAFSPNSKKLVMINEQEGIDIFYLEARTFRLRHHNIHTFTKQINAICWPIEHLILVATEKTIRLIGFDELVDYGGKELVGHSDKIREVLADVPHCRFVSMSSREIIVWSSEPPFLLLAKIPSPSPLRQIRFVSLPNMRFLVASGCDSSQTGSNGPTINHLTSTPSITQIWSTQNLRRVGHYRHDFENTFFFPDNECIVAHDIFSMQMIDLGPANIYNHKELDPSFDKPQQGHKGVSELFARFKKYSYPGIPQWIINSLNLENLKKQQAVTLNVYLHELFPDFFSYPLMQLAAAGSMNNLLQNLFNGEDLYTVDVDNRTPLYYLLEEENQTGIKILLRYFEDNPKEFLITHGEILLLLEKQIPTVLDLLQITLNEEGHELQQLSIKPEQLGRLLTPGKYSFDQHTSRNSNFSVFVSNFWFNTTPGSQTSRQMLSALAKNKYSSVWTAAWTKAYLNQKWKAIRPLLRLEAGLYFIFLALISIFSTALVDWISL